MIGTALSRSFIGYAPIVDRNRNAMATRLTVRAPRGQNISIDKYYQELTAIWGPDSSPVLLAVEKAALTDIILATDPVQSVWVEVPAELPCTPDGEKLVMAMHQKGFKMVLGGRTPAPLPAELVPAFIMSLIHVAEDRRLNTPSQPLPTGVKRTIPYTQVGITSIAMMERCFATGAQAVIGWPFEDALKHATSAHSNPDFATITKLIQLIDKGEDVTQMEGLIRRDAALAYRLLRYINSPAFGLRVEIQSFRHAVMMLGYQKLRRWLMLMITTSCKDANMRPLMFASFRRGLFLEHLVGMDEDETIRDEVFILGVFSLLDKLFKEPFDKLFAVLQVPERVQETLVGRGGPYAPYLAIAEAVEQGPAPELEDRLTDALLSIEQCNQAVVNALIMPETATA